MPGECEVGKTSRGSCRYMDKRRETQARAGSAAFIHVIGAIHSYALGYFSSAVIATQNGAAFVSLVVE